MNQTTTRKERTFYEKYAPTKHFFRGALKFFSLFTIPLTCVVGALHLMAGSSWDVFIRDAVFAVEFGVLMTLCISAAALFVPNAEDQ